MNNRYIKFKPSRSFFDLIESRPTAYCLLSLIVARARRSTNKVNGLKAGEAFIGDYKKYCASEQVYRTDKNLLKSTGWVTFRSTNRGTIAKVVNTDIFDINIVDTNELDNGQANTQLTDSQRLTKNVYKESNKESTSGKPSDENISYKKKGTNKTIGYLLNIPKEDISEFIYKFPALTEAEIIKQAETASDWLVSNGKTKKNYKAYLRNWLRNNQEKKVNQKGGLYDIPRG